MKDGGVLGDSSKGILEQLHDVAKSIPINDHVDDSEDYYIYDDDDDDVPFSNFNYSLHY